MTRLPFLPRSPNLRLNSYKPVYGRKVAILEHLADAGNPPFKFSLPAPMVSCAGSQARMNVLIVEDSRFLRISNERALQKAGYEVITAADGEEGLRLALERKPDLVILDIGLPKMDGYEVARHLKTKQQFGNTVIIMLSRRDGVIDRLKGRLAGAKDYITKPFRTQEVMSVVHSYLGVPVYQ